MKKRWFWLAGLVLSSSLILPGVTSAQQQPAGVVTALQGKAQLTRAAVPPVSLRFKDGLSIRDVVDTQEKSLVRILFGGKSTVTVRELSRLEVREELLPTGARRDVHDLSSGAILVNVARQLMRPGDEVQIRTPNAVAAVRGSTVFASYNPVLNLSFIAFIAGSGLVTPQGQPTITLTANTPNNGVNVTGTGPTVQATQVNVTPAQTNQIIQESKVEAPAKKEEANRQQTAQVQTQTATQLATAVVETITGVAPTTAAPAGTETAVQETATATTEPTPTTTTTTTAATTTTTQDTVTTAPVTAGGTGETITAAAEPPPVVSVSGTKTLAAGETLQTFSANVTATRNTNPTIQVSNATVIQDDGISNLVQINPGVTVALSGSAPFMKINPSDVSTDGVFIDIGGTLSLSAPLLVANDSILISGLDFVEVFGTLSSTTTQALIQLTNTSVTTFDAGCILLIESATGLTVTLSGPVLDAINSNLNVADAVLEIFGDQLTSTTTLPLVSLDGGSLKTSGVPFDLSFATVSTGGPVFKATNTTLTPTAGLPFFALFTSSLTAGGPFLDLANAPLNLGTGAVFNVFGGSTLSTATGPAIRISDGTLTADTLLATDGLANTITVTGDFFNLTDTTAPADTVATLRTLYEAKGTDVFKASGDFAELGTGSTLNLSGPLLIVSGGNVSVANVLNLGVPFTTPTGQPLIQVTGGTLAATGSLALMGANLTLGGAFLSESGGTVSASADALAVGANTLTSGTTAVFSLTGGTLTITGTGSDLVSVTGGTLTLGGSLLSMSTGTPTVTISGDALNIASTVTGPSTGSLVSIAAGTLTVTGDLVDLAAGSTLNLSGSFATVSGGSATVGTALRLGAPLTTPTGQPLLTVSGGSLSTTSSLATLGANLTLGGSFLSQSGGSVSTAADALSVGANTLTSGTDPVFKLTGGTLTVTGATSGLISVAGGSLTTTLGLAFLTGSGAALNLSGTLFSSATGSTVNADTILDARAGATVTGTGTAPFIQVNNSTLNMEFDVVFLEGIGTKLNVSAPFLSATNASNLSVNNILDIRAGATITGTGTAPFIQLNNTTLNLNFELAFLTGSSTKVDLQGPFVQISGGSVVPGINPLLTLSSGASLTAKGPLFDFTDLTLNLGTKPLTRVTGGSTLTNTAGPVIRISGGLLTADALGIGDSTETFNLTGTLLDLTNTTVTLRTIGEDVPDLDVDNFHLTLAANQPFYNLSNSTLNVTGVTNDDPLISLSPAETGTTFAGLGMIATNSTVINKGGGLLGMEGTFNTTATSPLLQIGSTVTVSDDLIEVEPLSPTAATNVTMAGQLLKGTGSTFNVNNRDVNTVIATVALGAPPIDDIAIISDKTTTGQIDRAYVPIPSTNSVKVINTNTNAVIATIAVGTNPLTVKNTPNDDRIFVLNNGSNNVSVINTHTNAVIATIPLPAGANPDAVAFTPDSNRAYVTNFGTNSVTVINVDLNSVITTIPVGTAPVTPAVTPDGKKVFVINNGSSNVSVIDTATNTVVATILVGTTPSDIGITPDGSKAYVSNAGSNNVSVINIANNTVIATIPVGTGGTERALGITPDGTKVYVVNPGSNNVSVINTTTNSVIATVPVGTTPSDIAISPDGKRAYVANEISNNISVIDTSTNTVIATVNVGTTPTALALTQNGLTLYVINEASNNVSVIDPINSSDFLSIVGGAKLTSTSALPLLEFNPSTVNTGGALVRVTGTGSSLTLAGALLKGTDTKFNIDRGVLRVTNGGTLTSTTTEALIQLTGTVAAASTVDTIFAFADVEGTGSKLTLSGPFLSSTNTTFNLGPNNVDSKFFLLFEEGAAITSTSANPFVTFNSSTLARSSRFLDLRRSPDNVAAAATMNLAGPLLSATGSIFTTSRDFIIVTERATLTGTGTTPLIQTSSSTFNIGDPALEQANFFRVDDNSGPQSVQGPATVTLAGPLLSDTNSTFTILDRFLDVRDGSTLTSTTTSALMQFSGSTVNTGNDFAFVTGSGSQISLSGPFLKNATSTYKTTNPDVNEVTNTVAVGTKPFDIAFSTQGIRAYVVNNASNSVSVINTRTNTVQTTISVGSSPESIDAEGSILLVVNSGSNNVSRIDAITNTVTNTISVGTNPVDVIILQNNEKAYVTNFDSNTVSVIDLESNSTSASKTISVGNGPEGIAVSPDGKKVGVLNQTSNTVSVIDTDNDTVIATITVGTKPVDGAFTLTGNKAYIANEGSDNVSVIDTTNNTVIATISVGDGPHAIAITPNSKRAYVANELSNNVSVIDTDPASANFNKVIATITVGTEPGSVDISRDGKRAYVANFGSNNVSVIDTENDKVIATVNVGSAPGTIALSGDGTTAFVLNENSNNVSVIDTADLANFIEVAGSALFKSTSTLPLLEFNPSTLNLGGNVVEVRGNGSKMELSGQLMKATDSAFNVRRLLRVRDGGTLTSTTTSPLFELIGTAADKSKVDALSGVFVIDQLNTTDKPPTVSLAGPFLSATKTTFKAGETTTNKRPFLAVADGGLLKSTGTGTLITFDGSTADPIRHFIRVETPDSTGAAPKIEIAGPLFEAKNSSNIKTISHFITVRDKGTLKGTGTAPLLKLDSSTFTIGDEVDGGGNFLDVTDRTANSNQGAGVVDLAGPFVQDSGSTFDIFDRFVDVRNGSSITSTSSDALIQLSSSTVDTELDFARITGSNSKITISGSFLSATNSTLNIGTVSDDPGDLLDITNSGQMVINSSNPVVQISGGTLNVGTSDSTSDNTPNRLFRLRGVNTDSTTGLGTDQPIKGPASTELTGATNPIGTLLKATDAATIEVKKGSGDTRGGNAVRIDTALYEATLPILDLIGSSTKETTLKTADSTIDIFKSKIVSQGPVVAMDKSFINVTNGAFINLTGGTEWKVTGDLLKLFNGAKIEVINGPLILVSGTSSSGSSPPQSLLDVSGALVNFGGTGNNKIIVNNTLCSGACATKGGSGVQAIQVKEGTTGSITIGSNPIQNSSLGSIQYQGTNTALIQTGTTGKVNITAPQVF